MTWWAKAQRLLIDREGQFQGLREAIGMKLRAVGFGSGVQYMYKQCLGDFLPF
jgi:hypothetical protein